eukprot:GEMP01116020.1.p1 GENE.GEMP01116020.1~~GEMP01116020.1.p1  ORF type:complete len:110 (-),score=1.31 GEMP01116020.1:154-483(-)
MSLTLFELKTVIFYRANPLITVAILSAKCALNFDSLARTVALFQTSDRRAFFCDFAVNMRNIHYWKKTEAYFAPRGGHETTSYVDIIFYIYTVKNHIYNVQAVSDNVLA